MGIVTLWGMNTHLRHLIQHLRDLGWAYNPTQTNGAPHFEHPHFGRVAIASTPADWEDECRYCMQRIRKAMRRHHALTPTAPPTPPPASAPFAEAFQRIQTLERELEQLQQSLPRMAHDVETLLAPLYSHMGEQRKELVQWLASQLCQAGWKRRQIQQIEDLCLHIEESTQRRLGYTLSEDCEVLQVLRRDRQQMQESLEEEHPDPMFDGFGVDEWERWFETMEAKTTYIPQEALQTKEKKPRRTTTPPPHVDALHKKLYLGLARSLHPDKTTDEDEKRQRTHLMQRLNAAYAKQDWKSLLHLLQSHGDPKLLPQEDALQQALAHSLQEQERALEAQILQLLRPLPPWEGNWRRVAASPSLWERQLRAQRRECEEEIARFQRILRELQRPRGLMEFLRDTDPWDWEELF